MKHWLKIVMLMALVVALSDLWRPLPTAAQANVDLSVNVGIDGYYRRGSWTAVRVNLSNSGDSLDGFIRVRTGGAGGLSETTYRTPLDLPQGARKQVFLYVSLESYEQRLQVEIVDQHGRVVARDTTPLLLATPGDPLYAVVTESAFGSVDLMAVALTSGRGHQSNWLIEDIPGQAQALAGLDVLMFHDVNTGALRAEQAAAIRQWVEAGGHLIIAGGDNWQRTVAGMNDLLPVTLRGTLALDSLGALADYVRQPVDPLDAGLTVSDSVPLPTAQTLVSANDVPLVVRQPIGLGMVDFLAFDPNAEPFRSWSAKDRFWYALVASTGQKPSWANGISDWSIAREATLTASTTTLPTFFQLCGFLTLYIVLMGPLNYVVLRKLNRRELAWFTIPAFIVIFSVLAYQVGFNLRGSVPKVNQLAVIQVPDQGEDAQVIGLLGVQSPRRSTYDIAVTRGYLLRTLPDVGTGLSVPVTITQSTRYLAEDVPIDAGTIASFVAEGYIPAPRLDYEVTWELADNAAPRLMGRVTNTTSEVLEDAVLLIKGESRYLGTLQPGETGTFDISLGPQDPAPLTVANAQAAYQPSYGGPWNVYRRSPGWCFTYRGVALTMVDVMRDEQFSCAMGRVSDSQQEIRRRYRLLASLLRENDLSGGRGAEVYLAAWSRTPVVEVELIGKPQPTQESTSLYLFELSAMVKPSTERVTIPPGLTTWTLFTDRNDTRVNLNVPPSRFQVGSTTQASFQFMPLPAVQLAEVEYLGIEFVRSGPVRLEIWDWTQGQWSELEQDSSVDMILVDQPDRFIGPENAVNIRIVTDEPTLFNHIDHLSVHYYGRLRQPGTS